MTPRDAFELYAAKGGCSYKGPQRTADRAFRWFAHFLTDDELRRLGVARSHVTVDACQSRRTARGEFDKVCGEIRARLFGGDNE